MKEYYSSAYNIVSLLVKHGYIAYFAGGYVRDMIMKRHSDDIDIATNAPLDVIKDLFDKTISVGEQFGILIVVENRHNFEVATFRKEEGHHDGRRPTIIYSASPQEDALRRDLTINGIFFDPIKSIFHDFVDGRGDIEKKIIKAIGNPEERFKEDRLRMIRAVRYATRFDFTIDGSTKKAIIKYSGSLFPSVAIERIHQELEKMSSFGSLEEGLRMLFDLQLLQVIFPATAYYTREILLDHLSIIGKLPPQTPLILCLIYLLDLSSLNEMHTMCITLKFSNQDKLLVKEFHQIKTLPFSADDYSWTQLYALKHCDLILLILSIEKNDKALLQAHIQRKNSLTQEILRAQTKKTTLTSDIFIKEGIRPGKNLGKLLKEGEKIAVNEKIHDPQKILSQLKTKYPQLFNLHHN